MQTFLPYSSFYQSARVLDRQRLGKQRVETLQILKSLSDPTYGWQNHPAVKMWRGYEIFLWAYGNTICREWKSRDYKDTCQEKMSVIYESHPQWRKQISLEGVPKWLGDESFHASHRSNLLRKDPIWYGEFGWTEPNDLPYVWPNGVLDG